MNRKSFTLLELLIVLAITGVLAAILMPVFGKAREGARRAMCANNLRQHGIAWYLYLDDHNECFPKAGMLNDDATGCDTQAFGGKYAALYGVHPRPINRYLDVTDTSAEVFHCPDDIKDGSHGIVEFDRTGNSYYCNPRVLIFGWPVYTHRPLATITRSHDKVYLEMCFPGSNPGHSGRGYIYNNNLVMVLFIDGHVKGPYKDMADFDYSADGQYPERPVYVYTNTSPNEFD